MANDFGLAGDADFGARRQVKAALRSTLSQAGAKSAAAHPARAAHTVRIIGGQWKRTPLLVLAAQGLRPTPDRVRETVFNWLSHLFDGHWQQLRCLDLFAGSGALGFEAASRGAAQVLMVENHTPAVHQLGLTKDKLQAAQVEILRADALGAVVKLAQSEARYDLIFLDPPYHQDWLAKMLPHCAPLLAPNGVLYLEAEQALQAEVLALSGWALLRADRAGSVFYHLVQRMPPIMIAQHRSTILNE